MKNGSVLWVPEFEHRPIVRIDTKQCLHPWCQMWDVTLKQAAVSWFGKLLRGGVFSSTGMGEEC